jgi:hypothetical protein
MIDPIERQDAIDALTRKMVSIPTAGEKDLMGDVNRIRTEDISVIRRLPSAQSEHTCVNCGRTVNNGGWYADGGTRCPIEEHYALPKDGYCNLWEKRNITDDDYPERRTDE